MLYLSVLLSFKGAAVRCSALMLFQPCVPLQGPHKKGRALSSAHIPALVSWADPGGCSLAAVGTRGCRSSRDLQCACRRAAAQHPCPWGPQHTGEVQRLGFWLHYPLHFKHLLVLLQMFFYACIYLNIYVCIHLHVNVCVHTGPCVPPVCMGWL